MTILPNNIDPSKDYVTPGVDPAMSTNGLVYNKIYAHTGVIDSLGNTTVNGYDDPNLNTVNNNNGLVSFSPKPRGYWISNTDFGGPNSTPIVLTYSFVNTTYYNNLSFYALNVPCYVEILDANYNPLPGTSTFIVPGGSDIFTTTDWVLLNYNAPMNPSPATVTGTNGVSNFTYPLTCNNNIYIRITRNKTVQTSSPINGLSNVAYSVGVKDFRIKLNVQALPDIPTTVYSGTNTVTTQNRFRIVENYSYASNPVSNMFVNTSSYWKSGPQPVKDAIVYFYVKVSDTISGTPVPATINRLYIDPLYSNCKFNVYYTSSGSTAPVSGSIGVDPGTFSWTPIQRDFTLRKGIYEIPTTVCTYLKFEFTSLVPEVYDLPFDSINRTINVFPYDVETFYENLEQDIINGNAVTYSTIGNSNLQTQPQRSNQIGGSTIFGVSNQTIGNASNWQNLSQLNSSQLGNTTTNNLSSSSQIVDPSISYKLLDANGNYNQSSYTAFLQRRFPDNRVHNYNQITINQTWHQAYFTGIRYLTAFYETVFDDLRALPGTLIASNSTTSGFSSQDVNYVGLNVDDIAVTPWFNTVDTFNSFSIGGLTTDWRSFLTQGNPISTDPALLNGIPPISTSSSGTPKYIGALGSSSIYAISGNGSAYGLKSIPYNAANNLLSYNDANFIPNSTMPYGSVAGPWTLIFDDEFTGNSLNTNVWAPNWFGESGVMNNVVTHSGNVSVSTASGLNLLLASSGSGALISSNPNGGAISGFQFTYGYAEAQVTFPNNQDWSSFWTDGQNWPLTGEFDIAETTGGASNQIWVGNYHYSVSGSATSNIDPSPLPSGYLGSSHIFGMDWEPNLVNFYVDGVLHRTISGSIVVSSPQYIILNHGVYPSGNATGVGSVVNVRYVRVWQH